ncbi:MAG: hypothetical protein WEA82_09070 [Idiomarina sp.]
MDEDSPNYSEYTIDELEDVLIWIDQEKWPERYIQAKAILARKIKERVAEPNSEGDQVSPLPPKPKWSEQLLITRIVMGSFMLILFSGVAALFSGFMAAKNWTANTTGAILGLAFIWAMMWFLSLKKDSRLMQRLERSWGGQIAMVFMPLFFLMFSWLFIDKSLPLGLHWLSAQQEMRYEMDYQKGPGRKYCRQQVEIIETDELEYGDLCMSERQRNSLPEQGRITVVGTRSQFGLLVDGFILP